MLICEKGYIDDFQALPLSLDPVPSLGFCSDTFLFSSIQCLWFLTAFFLGWTELIVTLHAQTYPTDSLPRNWCLSLNQENKYKKNSNSCKRKQRKTASHTFQTTYGDEGGRIWIFIDAECDAVCFQGGCLQHAWPTCIMTSWGLLMMQVWCVQQWQARLTRIFCDICILNTTDVVTEEYQLMCSTERTFR